MYEFKLDWNSINVLFNSSNAHMVHETQASIDNLLNSYSDIFEETLGCFNGGKVKLHLKKNATPRFIRARTVPFAIKERVENEIRRLVSKDILEPVTFSDWATPIVPILKKNKDVRICGDFRCTFNPESKVDQYPLPNIQELLSNFSNKSIFTKLDMSDAY